jgi:hypothetical protein
MSPLNLKYNEQNANSLFYFYYLFFFDWLCSCHCLVVENFTSKKIFNYCCLDSPVASWLYLVLGGVYYRPEEKEKKEERRGQRQKGERRNKEGNRGGCVLIKI